MLRECSVRYFVEIHELQTKLGVFKTGAVNFGTRCSGRTFLAARLTIQSQENSSWKCLDKPKGAYIAT